MQNTAKRFNDQVAPFVAVKPSDEKDLFGVALFQPPSLGRRYGRDRVGNHFRFRQSDP